MQEFPGTLNILARSPQLIAVEKPAGVLSVPARFADDARPCLGTHLQRTLGQRIFPVHRLDFEVAGPVLFALTADAQRIANRWFEDHLIVKKYEALSERLAAPGGPLLDWKSLLVKGKKRAFEAPYGKPALTKARCLEVIVLAGNSYSRWELFPISGRSHQLRYELAKHCGPIWGDRLYGAERDFAPGAIALGCVELDLSGIAERLGMPTQVRHPAVFENRIC